MAMLSNFPCAVLCSSVQCREKIEINVRALCVLVLISFLSLKSLKSAHQRPKLMEFFDKHAGFVGLERRREERERELRWWPRAERAKVVAEGNPASVFLSLLFKDPLTD